MMQVFVSGSACDTGAASAIIASCRHCFVHPTKSSTAFHQSFLLPIYSFGSSRLHPLSRPPSPMSFFARFKSAPALPPSGEISMAARSAQAAAAASVRDSKVENAKKPILLRAHSSGITDLASDSKYKQNPIPQSKETFNTYQTKP
jgi:hypothetical protein